MGEEKDFIYRLALRQSRWQLGPRRAMRCQPARRSTRGVNRGARFGGLGGGRLPRRTAACPPSPGQDAEPTCRDLPTNPGMRVAARPPGMLGRGSGGLGVPPSPAQGGHKPPPSIARPPLPPSTGEEPPLLAGRCSMRPHPALPGLWQAGACSAAPAPTARAGFPLEETQHHAMLVFAKQKPMTLPGASPLALHFHPWAGGGESFLSSQHQGGTGEASRRRCAAPSSPISVLFGQAVVCRCLQTPRPSGRSRRHALLAKAEIPKAFPFRDTYQNRSIPFRRPKM